jgi:hypothetical protein
VDGLDEVDNAFPVNVCPHGWFPIILPP